MRFKEKRKWADDRTQPSQLLSDTPLPARPVKPHDWTYSSCHTGQIAGPSVCPLTLFIFLRFFLPCSTSHILALKRVGSRNRTDYQKFVPSTTHEIPITFLARQDPVLDQILYYADVPLFEDELHDNGESILNARIVSPIRQDCYPSTHHNSPLSPDSSSLFIQSYISWPLERN
jgi:type 2A phosphatase activator TIP41